MNPVFKAANLSQEQATKLVHGFVEYMQGQPARRLEADLKVTQADPQLGQLNFAKTQANVNRALAGFTDPEFRQLLERTGLANRLEFVRVFDRIGRAMAGDTAAMSQPASAPEESVADRLYNRSRKVS